MMLSDDLLLHGWSHTTIGAAAFHFRVRDGIGWFHSAMVAEQACEAARLRLLAWGWVVASDEGPTCDVEAAAGPVARSRLELYGQAARIISTG
jgi:hypothetical protein